VSLVEGDADSLTVVVDLLVVVVVEVVVTVVVTRATVRPQMQTEKSEKKLHILTRRLTHGNGLWFVLDLYSIQCHPMTIYM